MKHIRVSLTEKNLKRSHIKNCQIAVVDKDGDEFIVEVKCDFIFKTEGVVVKYNLFDSGLLIGDFIENYSNFVDNIKNDGKFVLETQTTDENENDVRTELSYSICAPALEKFGELIAQFINEAEGEEGKGEEGEEEEEEDEDDDE